jgi:hypothetical protein
MVGLDTQRVKPQSSRTKHKHHVQQILADDNIIALVVFQNLADSGKVRGACGEMYPGTCPDAYQPISIKVEKLSDAEQEEYPLPITFPGIMGEPEVSCVSVSVLEVFHKDGIPRFVKFFYNE